MKNLIASLIIGGCLVYAAATMAETLTQTEQLQAEVQQLSEKVTAYNAKVQVNDELVNRWIQLEGGN